MSLSHALFEKVSARWSLATLKQLLAWAAALALIFAVTRRAAGQESARPTTDGEYRVVVVSNRQYTPGACSIRVREIVE